VEESTFWEWRGSSSSETTNFTPFHFLSYPLLPATVIDAPLAAKRSRYLKYSADCYFHSEDFKYRTKGSTAIAFRGTLRAAFLKAQIS
jgi:hypothetical protein